MVFVVTLIRINSSETSAACAAGVICFIIHYCGIATKLDSARNEPSRKK